MRRPWRDGWPSGSWRRAPLAVRGLRGRSRRSPSWEIVILVASTRASRAASRCSTVFVWDSTWSVCTWVARRQEVKAKAASDEGKQQKNGAPGDEQEFDGGQFGGWQTHGRLAPVNTFTLAARARSQMSENRRGEAVVLFRVQEPCHCRRRARRMSTASHLMCGGRASWAGSPGVANVA